MQRIPEGGIMFTSDWHCGLQSNGHSRDEEIQTVLNNIVNKARELRPFAVVVAGDLTDSPRYPGMTTASMVGGTLVALADTGATVYVVKGNHDWEGISLFGLSNKNNVRVIMTPQAVEISPNQYLIAVPHLRRHELGDLTYDDIIKNLHDSLPAGADCIAVVHAALDGTIPDIKEDCVTRKAMNCGISHMYLGHIHQHKSLRNNIYYTGSIIRNTFGELKEHSGLWYMQNGEVYDIPIDGARKMHEVIFETPEAVGNGCLESAINDILTKDKDALIKVHIIGGSVYQEQIEDIVQCVETEYTEKKYNIIAYDYNKKKNVEPVKVNQEFEKKSAVDIAKKISASDLWREYCIDKLNTDNTISNKDAHIITECGQALMTNDTPENIWAALKNGQFDKIAEKDKTMESILPPVVPVKTKDDTKEIEKSAPVQTGYGQTLLGFGTINDDDMEIII